MKLDQASKDKKVFVRRIKNRVHPDFDPMEAGGYRDVLINLSFEEEGHQVELQLNLLEFVKIKNSGGHAAYVTARMLQAFDREVIDFIGVVDEAACTDLGCGLTKRMTATKIVEAAKFTSALQSRSCQLVELKILNVEFGADLKDAKWLDAVFQSLASTLHTVQINSCNIEGVRYCLF